MLEKLSVEIKASFLVAGFVKPLGNDYFDIINKTFLNRDFDWEKIRKSCKYFFVYHSDNDPYVPLPMGRELAEKLNSKLKIVKDAGHFNESSGYKKFEILLNDIKKVIAKDL